MVVTVATCRDARPGSFSRDSDVQVRLLGSIHGACSKYNATNLARIPTLLHGFGTTFFVFSEQRTVYWETA